MYKEPRPIIVCKNYDISIQGSATHYSEPRAYLENIGDYVSVEVALFSKNGEWLNPKDDALFIGFTGLEELQELYEEGRTAVGGYVPLALLESLLLFLAGKEQNDKL